MSKQQGRRVAPNSLRGVARHGRLPQRSGLKTAAKIIAGGLAVVTASSVSLAAYATWNVAHQISDNAVVLTQDDTDSPTPAPEIDELEGGFNVLFVGADNEEGQNEAEFGKRGATLNDFNMLLHVSADHTNATALSIPRDLVISHPECSDATTGQTYSAMSAQPVNEAMGRGGLPCVVDTVENLTGLSIPYAAVLSFDGVRGISDAIGGVEVCVADPINDKDSGLQLEAGVQTLSGDEALKFLRTRHGVGDGSDLARISGQQAYLSSLLRKVKSDGTLSNVGTLYSLANVAAQTITLSSSLANVDQMIGMARVFRNMDLANVTFVQYPALDDPDRPGKIIPNEAQSDPLLALIAADQPVILDGDSTGRGTELDPNAPAAPVEPEPAATGDATAPAAPGGTPSSAAPQTTAPAAAPTPIKDL